MFVKLFSMVHIRKALGDALLLPLVLIIAFGLQAATASAQSSNLCHPPCRAGFFCSQGECISECNPPCGAGARCVEGECLIPAPQYATPPAQGAAQYPQLPPRYGAMDGAPLDPSARFGRYEHDGFMFRGSIGLGWGSANFEPDEGADYEIYGSALSLAVDIGTSVLPSLSVHGRLATTIMVEPRASYDGSSAGIVAKDSSLVTGLIGGGVTWYLMPLNLYVTGALGLTNLVFRYGDERSSQTELGLALNLDVGKEWWLEEDWGLGVAARVWISRVNEDSRSIVVPVISALFSATYQ